jgi:4-methylaminobutanoate oxidase (formaldehyde-forming)
LSALSLARFGDRTWSEDELRQRAAWQYRHFYSSVC